KSTHEIADALERGPWRRGRAARVALARVGCPLGCPSEGYPRRSIGERNLDRHAVLGHCSFLENFPCFLDQLVCTDGVPSGNMAQDQPPRLRCECYLSRLSRRRMPRLLGPLLLLLPKRRLVNQQVRPLRRIDDGCARPGIACEDHGPPATFLPDDSFRDDSPPVSKLDRLTAL